MSEKDHSLNWELAKLIDQFCLEFEVRLGEGRSPRIEEYLQNVDPGARQVLLSELAELELAYLSRLGQAVSQQGYLERFPKFAKIISEGFNRRTVTIVDSDCKGSTYTLASDNFKKVELQPFAEREFKNYVQLKEIARGGMGVVYQARERGLDRIVALKMILSGGFATAEDIERFYTEARAAALLDHPHTVPILEVGEHEGQHFYSMAYIEGESLSDRTKRGPLSPKPAAQLICPVAEAVAYAHRQGIVHRDLNPANILLDQSGMLMAFQNVGAGRSKLVALGC